MLQSIFLSIQKQCSYEKDCNTIFYRFSLFASCLPLDKGLMVLLFLHHYYTHTVCVYKCFIAAPHPDKIDFRCLVRRGPRCYEHFVGLISPWGCHSSVTAGLKSWKLSMRKCNHKFLSSSKWNNPQGQKNCTISVNPVVGTLFFTFLFITSVRVQDRLTLFPY